MGRTHRGFCIIGVNGGGLELMKKLSKGFVDGGEADLIYEIDRKIKEHVGNALHEMSGLSARVTQLESRMHQVENVVDDLKVAIEYNYGKTDGKLRELDNIMRGIIMATEKESSSASNSTSSAAVLKRKSNDVGWEYGILVDPNNLDNVCCKLCGKVFSGGVYRIKEHVGKITGNVAACIKASKEDQEKCKQAILDARNKKNKLKEISEVRKGVRIRGEENEVCELDEIESRPHRFKGPLDRWTCSVSPPPSMGTLRQQNISETLFKERTHYVRRLVAKWVYESGIPFNVIDNDSFIAMMEGVGQFGPGFKPPSQYQLREPLLKEEVENSKEALKKHESLWSINGCSLMADVWSDRKMRSIMNLCVNCKEGTTFLSSKEGSEESHIGQHIYEYVLNGIEQVGQENVVQVVTDNAANNMAAAKLLKEKMPHIFWTSCATHTINLMLEGIGKLTRFKKTIDNAKTFTIFIYAHHKTLAMMRSYTNRRDIVRPGVTRFASAFLTLQSLVEKKENLRRMFTSKEWDECKWAKTAEGKTAYTTVMSIGFWNGVTQCLKVFAPLVNVLRLVDGDRKPSMGFVYGELKKAKEDIKVAMNNVENNYRSIFEIIDKQSKDRLDSHLHLVAYLLNPYYFYKDPSIEYEPNLQEAVFICVEVFFAGDFTKQSDVINRELPEYKTKSGHFGKKWAAQGCESNHDSYDPITWWGTYGHKTPNLRRMTIRILSLTTSSSGCERNWSNFEGIHTKKRNRLDVNRLNNLVYVSFNAKLKNKQKRDREKKMDVLLSKEASNAQAWIVEDGDDKEVEAGTGLTWELVGEAMGADDMIQPRRSERNVELRELDEDDFESDEEMEEDVDFESDEENVFEEYGEEEIEDQN